MIGNFPFEYFSKWSAMGLKSGGESWVVGCGIGVMFELFHWERVKLYLRQLKKMRKDLSNIRFCFFKELRADLICLRSAAFRSLNYFVYVAVIAELNSIAKNNI